MNLKSHLKKLGGKLIGKLSVFANRRLHALLTVNTKVGYVFKFHVVFD